MDLAEVSTDILIKSISGHMDALSRLMSLIFLINVVALFSVLTGRKDLVFGAVEADRKYGFMILSAINISLMAGVFIVFYRLAGLLTTLAPDDEATIQGLTTLTKHPFLLNPFAYFGEQQYYLYETGRGIDFINLSSWLSLIGFFLVLLIPFVATPLMGRLTIETAHWSRAVTVPLIFFLLLGAVLGYFYVNSVIGFHIDDAVFQEVIKERFWRGRGLFVFMGIGLLISITLLIVLQRASGKGEDS